MFALRKAVLDDIPQIWEVRGQAIKVGCRKHYSEEDIQRWASVPLYPEFPTVVEQTDFYVIADTRRIAAFGFLDQRKSEIGAMFVHPEFQALGFGRRILSTLEGIARQSALSSLSLIATLNAERFYSAAGFRSQARTKWKHPNGFELDCVPMNKELLA